MVGQLVRAGEPKVIGDNENRMAKLRSRDNWYKGKQEVDPPEDARPPNSPLRMESVEHEEDPLEDARPPNSPLRMESARPPNSPLRMESARPPNSPIRMESERPPKSLP